jgi:hypothetical protein
MEPAFFPKMPPGQRHPEQLNNSSFAPPKQALEERIAGQKAEFREEML